MDITINKGNERGEYMKKVYNCPEIHIEKFELSSHIASCGIGANSGNSFGKPLFKEDKCGWQDAFGNVVFLIGHEHCREQYADGEYEGMCYNTPTPSIKIFMS